jgi:hypothetical protein
LLGYLAESAFPVYVLHQPVTVLIAYAVVRLPLGIAFKFPLLLGSSILMTMLVYHVLVRPVSVVRVALGMKPLCCRIKVRPNSKAAVA